MDRAFGQYTIEKLDFSTANEVDLLRHYHSPERPYREQYHHLRVVELEVDQAWFVYDDQQIRIMQNHSDQTQTQCSCNHREEGICNHVMLALMAILYNRPYHLFFNKSARRLFFIDYAMSFGLQEEPDLDDYFRLIYDKGSLSVLPINGEIIAVEQRSIIDIPKPKRPEKLAKHRIIVLGKHRFYKNLKIDLLDTSVTGTGKLRAPFEHVDTQPLLWHAKEIEEVKFYAAISNLQNNYNEDDTEQHLIALQQIIQNPLHLPYYVHHPTRSEKFTNQSLSKIGIKTLDAKIELSVLQKDPFYELRAELIWDEQRFPIKTLQLHFQYFLQKENTYYLLPNSAWLAIIEFFKKNPEIVLIHKNKYAEFKQHSLDPLDRHITINYGYIRKASPDETTYTHALPREQIIYLTQEGSFVNITPVVRYGSIEIPVASQNAITAKDDNGNPYLVERHISYETQLQQSVCRQHDDFPAQLRQLDYFYLHHHQFLDEQWFMTAFEQWNNEGITVLGFRELNITKFNPYKPKVDIKIISGTDWFNTKIIVSYGDTHASMKQLHKAIRHKHHYVELDDGSIGMLPQEWMEKIATFFQFSILEKELLKVPKVHFSELEELVDRNTLPEEIQTEIKALHENLSQNTKLAPIHIPDTLRASLRPYQKEGVQWLSQLDALNFGGCLADDMGLGKTLQMIAFLLIQREKHLTETNLVVVPTSVLFNWQQELRKFAPELSVLTWSGASRKKTTDQFNQHNVILTTYGYLLSDITTLKSQRFNTIILDESQAIKNPNSERNRAARLLKARIRFVLTGTPIENSTYDLYGQLSFACPGLLGDQRYFRDTFATPIDRFQDSKRAKQLQKKTAPFVLRRTKAQVASELPEKTEVAIYCEMGEAQRALYNIHEEELKDYLNGVQNDEIDRENFHVLAGLTRLRQICNAPHLLKEGYDKSISCKLEAILEQLETLGNNHKVLIFSQFVEMLDLIRGALEQDSIPYEYLTGATKNREQVVDRFQSDPQKRVFLISLKAGGVGLNLTAADYVFLIDPWWNPAVENQAIDRSYRIGQNKPVVAVRFICKDTVEEKIQKLQDKKKHLASEMVLIDHDATSKFDKSDWLNLVI